MKISEDGRTLFFSDDEIEKRIDGEKKVYVTKRINGKESHNKIDKTTKKFDFNNEIVIGVTSNNRQENKKQSNNKTKITTNNSKDYNFKENDRKIKNKRIKKSKKKKKKKSKMIFKICCLVVIIGSIAIFSLKTPIFNIKNIYVEGNNKISTDTIISLSGIKKESNIFKYNNSVIQKIKENQYIEDVLIKRKLPGTIQIVITERSIKYQIKLINSFAYIDKNGYILETSSVKAEVPIIVGFHITENELLNKKRLDIVDLEKLNKVLKVFESSRATEIDKLITEVNIEDETDLCLYLENCNKKAYIGDTNDLTKKMLYLKKIIEEETNNSGEIYINGDISNGFKPYFRPE